MAGLGRALIALGLGLVLLGALLWAGSRLGLGRLPGDLSFRRGSVSFYFPLASSLLLSLLLTLLLNVIFRR
ncbi:MAG: DUF2905 domain-containing protein [Actinomycetia bacterium]|jgi:hypothetical protein|nr:DUF2905 domain-containing protein [Actinomycetes bacterium]